MQQIAEIYEQTYVHDISKNHSKFSHNRRITWQDFCKILKEMMYSYIVPSSMHCIKIFTKVLGDPYYEPLS